MVSKSFKNWRKQQIEKVFQLKQVEDCKWLKDWLSTEIAITENEQEVLTSLIKKAKSHIDSWNEQELIMKFIGPIINLVDFDGEYYSSFVQRQLTAEVKGFHLNGYVDLMIASGKYEPEKPYFCLHEYKKEEGFTNDPRGQMLAEMVTAQALNKDDLPVYGSYVMGRWWFFAVLHKNEYCISNDYSATNDISEVVKILKALKQIINKRVEAQLNNPSLHT